MTTQLEIDLALMAGASYISTRLDPNKFPVPDGWLEIIDERQALSSGFEAVYFQNIANPNNIVISYAGTYDGSPLDYVADAGLAIGIGSVQLMQAVDYYLQVKAVNPRATN
jgi:hypothetical protein